MIGELREKTHVLKGEIEKSMAMVNNLQLELSSKNDQIKITESKFMEALSRCVCAICLFAIKAPI